MKNRGRVLIDTFNKTHPPFFTGRKLRPPGIRIEATLDTRWNCHKAMKWICVLHPSVRPSVRLYVWGVVPVCECCDRNVPWDRTLFVSPVTWPPHTVTHSRHIDSLSFFTRFNHVRPVDTIMRSSCKPHCVACSVVRRCATHRLLTQKRVKFLHKCSRFLALIMPQF